MPLSHIKVIDLCRARAGPTCVRQLSEMGAQVIKVEAPDPEVNNSLDRHHYDFQNIHPNKRSLTLNLKTEEGRQILLRMVKDADVLVENYRPDVKHRLRIDYETLSKINPRLIYASVSGYGQTGPYSKRAGVDQIAQGLSGLMSINGHPDGGPVLHPFRRHPGLVFLLPGLCRTARTTPGPGAVGTDVTMRGTVGLETSMTLIAFSLVLATYA